MLLSAGLSGVGQIPTAAPALIAKTETPLAVIITGNQLRAKGKRPFHLQVSFQFYDLSEKADEQGSLEYWWAEADGSHVEITSPSLGSLDSTNLDGAKNAASRRRLYLVRELLDAVLAPAASAAPYTGQTVASEQSMGSYKLKCLQAGQAPDGTEVCTGQVGTAIRTVTQPDYLLVRNMIGQFAATQVAIDETIYFAGRMAVKGHVEKLEGFDPAQHPGLLEAPVATPAQSGQAPTTVPAKVLKGQLLTMVTPSYPDSALVRRLSGKVLLLAQVTEKGKVEGVIAIASTDEALTQAAMAAVKQWTYKPYLLNGAPSEVEAMVTVNFNRGIE